MAWFIFGGLSARYFKENGKENPEKAQKCDKTKIFTVMSQK